MEFSAFCRKILAHTAGSDYARTLTVRLYMSGCRGRTVREKTLFRYLNSEVAHVKSSTLRGNYLVANKKGELNFPSPVCIIEMGSLHKYYEMEGWDAACAEVRRQMGTLAAGGFDIQTDMSNFEEIRDNLVLQIFSEKKAKKEHPNCIHFSVADLTVCLRARLHSQRGFSYTDVTEEDLREWNKQIGEELDTAAYIAIGRDNMERKYPPRLYVTMEDFRASFDGEDRGGFMPDDNPLMPEIEELPDCDMIYLSVKGLEDGIDGAIAIFYDRVLTRLLDLLGSGFYVFFYHPDQVMIMPDDREHHEEYRSGVQMM